MVKQHHRFNGHKFEQTLVDREGQGSPWLLFEGTKFQVVCYSHCCCSVTKSRLTLCSPIDCSMTGSSVLYYILEFAQSHAFKSVILFDHLVLCCPLLLLPSIFASIMVFSSKSALCIMWAKYQSFSFSIRLFNEFQGGFPLGLTGLISMQSKGLSRIFSNTMGQKHRFFSNQLSLQSNCHIHT